MIFFLLKDPKIYINLVFCLSKGLDTHSGSLQAIVQKEQRLFDCLFEWTPLEFQKL